MIITMALERSQSRPGRGRPAGGTLGGVVGTPFADLENRTHTHLVNSIAVPTESVGSHSHTVDPPLTVTTTDAHNHQWAAYRSGVWQLITEARTFEDVVEWTDGVGGEGSGHASLGVAFGHADEIYHTVLDFHVHTSDVPLFASSQAGSHGHNVNVASTRTGGSGKRDGARPLNFDSFPHHADRLGCPDPLLRPGPVLRSGGLGALDLRLLLMPPKLRERLLQQEREAGDSQSGIDDIVFALLLRRGAGQRTRRLLLEIVLSRIHGNPPEVVIRGERGQGGCDSGCEVLELA